MLTTTGAVPHMMISKVIPSSTSCGAPAAHAPQKYDSDSFSERAEAPDSFFMNLVSRISQDVRTATTTADIRELHQAVQSGTYTPDPHAIASRMLFFAEA